MPPEGQESERDIGERMAYTKVYVWKLLQFLQKKNNDIMKIGKSCLLDSYKSNMIKLRQLKYLYIKIIK